VPPASAAQPTAVPEEVAAPDVVVGRQPVAESAEVAARPREAAAVQDAAGAVQQQAAERDVEVAVLPQVAERDVEVAVLPQVAVAAVRLPGAARDVEAARRRAVQGEVLAVRPSAAAWAAGHPCLQELARPAPSPPGRSGHARKAQRIAQP
jgi:hypothetical protein